MANFQEELSSIDCMIIKKPFNLHKQLLGDRIYKNCENKENVHCK